MESLVNELLFVVTQRWLTFVLVAALLVLPTVANGFVLRYQYAIEWELLGRWLLVDCLLLQVLPYSVVVAVIYMAFRGELNRQEGGILALFLMLVLSAGFIYQTSVWAIENHPAYPDVVNGVKPRKWPDR